MSDWRQLDDAAREMWRGVIAGGSLILLALLATRACGVPV